MKFDSFVARGDDARRGSSIFSLYEVESVLGVAELAAKGFKGRLGIAIGMIVENSRDFLVGHLI